MPILAQIMLLAVVPGDGLGLKCTAQRGSQNDGCTSQTSDVIKHCDGKENCSMNSRELLPTETQTESVSERDENKEGLEQTVYSICGKLSINGM